ncbi:hypothetical protein MMC30_004778 [Trapelia coarctata]|nr:hypothetical protein [Trapelia coarctata]
MSDEEDDYYDDDEYYYIDEGPVAEADDLAAHAVQSPTYDLAQEYSEDYTDYEGYYSDEYYDEIPASKSKSQKQTSATVAKGNEKPVARVGLKRKSAGQPTSRKQKRRKLAPTQDIPELSLGESLESDGDLSEPCSRTPIVIWKTEETFMPLKWPVMGDREGNKVALLKDWRERFKAASKPDSEAFGGTVEGQEVGGTSGSEGNTARTVQAGHKGKAENGGRLVKRQASRKEEDGRPRTRALPSRQAANPAARTASDLPTASRKRKAEEDLPDPEEETDTISRRAATADGKTVRRAVAVVIPSSKSQPTTGQKKGVASEPAQKKTNGSPPTASTAEAGTGNGTRTRRSKRSKPG